MGQKWSTVPILNFSEGPEEKKICCLRVVPTQQIMAGANAITKTYLENFPVGFSYSRKMYVNHMLALLTKCSYKLSISAISRLKAPINSL